jgi:hypothetical protein
MILPYNLNNIVDKNMTFLPFPFIPTIQFKKHYQTHSRLLLPGFFFKKKELIPNGRPKNIKTHHDRFP